MDLKDTVHICTDCICKTFPMMSACVSGPLGDDETTDTPGDSEPACNITEKDTYKNFNDLCIDEVSKETHECSCLGEFKMVDLLCSSSTVCPPDVCCHDPVVAGCHKTNKKPNAKMCSPN